jgi:BSD domain
MWAALKSDLSEFVTGVAEETDQVIGSATKFSDEGEVLEGGFEATGVVQSPEDEVARLQGHVETYAEALDESDETVHAFLDSFKIDEKTQEIAKILEDHPETIKKHFEALVPTEISYELFWQRYFYRCDEDRIAREWEQEEEANRQARANALAGGLSSVTSLFGGAMAAVSKAVAADSRGSGGEVPVSPFGNQSASTASAKGGGLYLFGSGGRPPFVMNTAVDEDDDIGEEEEEEELGWDDDEEEGEEEEEEDPSNAMDVSEEITFSGGNHPDIDRLSEQLVQALSERDALKETIAMQNREIANLKEGKAPETGASAKDFERLKLSLFEKDAELAALKASLDDTHEDDKDDNSKKDAAKIAALERDVGRLNSLVSERDAELAAAKEAAEELRNDMVRMRETAASGQEVLQSSLDMAKAETDSLRQALESSSGSSEELEAAKDELTCAQAKIEALTLELQTTTKELADSKQYSVNMEQEVKELEEQLAVLQAKLSAGIPVEQAPKDGIVDQPPAEVAPEEQERASPSSESTGVKVDAAPPVRPSDAEDDWGDDWGDEEEE